ncbi:hypothetical protein Q9233_012991 [Columba guinea]|nr:hypothetical protein Q9233_012991 [Columba guinea]
MAQEQYLSSVLPQGHQAALESFKLLQLLMVMASYWGVDNKTVVLRPKVSAGFYYLDSLVLGHGTLNDESGLSEAELESLRKAQGWLEQMRQLKETEDQVSAAKRNILQAVTLALEEHDVQEEKIEIKGVDEAGAETLLGTFTYDVNKMIAQTFHAQDESGLSEAELESLRKAQGWLEQMRQLKKTEDQVSAAKRNILQAVTLALEEHDVQEEKIEIKGVDEAGAETLLGTFTYDVNKMIAQTFHAQSMWLAEDLSERDTLKELSLLMPPACPSEDPLPLKLA